MNKGTLNSIIQVFDELLTDLFGLAFFKRLSTVTSIIFSENSLVIRHLSNQWIQQTKKMRRETFSENKIFYDNDKD